MAGWLSRPGAAGSGSDTGTGTGARSRSGWPAWAQAAALAALLLAVGAGWTVAGASDNTRATVSVCRSAIVASSDSPTRGQAQAASCQGQLERTAAVGPCPVA
jgi:hypothetical protein